MHIYKRKYNTPEYRKKYTGIYGSWYAMKQRCNNPNYKQYQDYGGRGITYDPQWETFANFKEDMQEGYKKELTLDRIDTDGDYCKKNCRWATRAEQNINKRCNQVLPFNGKTQTIKEWADELGLNFGTVRSRFYRGMSTQDILKPTLYRPRKLLN